MSVRGPRGGRVRGFGIGRGRGRGRGRGKTTIVCKRLVTDPYIHLTSVIVGVGIVYTWARGLQ